MFEYYLINPLSTPPEKFQLEVTGMQLDAMGREKEFKELHYFAVKFMAPAKK